MKHVILLVAVLALVGCSGQDYSKNMQQSTVRSVTDLGSSAALDELTGDNYEKVKADTIEATKQIKQFILDGKLNDLPLDQVEQALVKFLREKGWSDPFVESLLQVILTFVKQQQVDIDKFVSPFTKYLLLEACDSTIAAATKHKAEWRRPKTNEDKMINLDDSKKEIEVKTGTITPNSSGTTYNFTRERGRKG